jgi:hypothetical protein
MIMQEPSFFALIIFTAAGEESFGGAFIRKELAEEKGRKSGAPFEVRPAIIE